MNTVEFTKIVKQYEKLIFTVCHRFVNDYHEAENLTQDTFLTAYKVIDDFVGDNYKPWLVKIATNKCKDFLKSAYHRKIDISPDEEFLQVADETQIHIEVEEEDYISMVKNACQNLKEPYSKVAIMYFIEEKSFKDISDELDVPIKTVQTQTYRARDKLKKILKEGLCNA